MLRFSRLQGGLGESEAEGIFWNNMTRRILVLVVEMKILLIMFMSPYSRSFLIQYKKKAHPEEESVLLSAHAIHPLQCFLGESPFTLRVL